MNPFVKRIGGKFYLKNKILEYFPKEINDYIEPFLGGGSIFLNLESKGIKVKTTSYLNDLDTDIFTIWKVFYEKNLFKELMQYFDKFSIYSNDCFNYFSQLNPKNDVEKAFRYMMLSMMSFQGIGTSYYIGINDVNRTNSKIYKPQEYWEKFHNYLIKYNVKISNCDYKNLLKGPFNRKSSFAYVDPPYLETRGYDNLPFKQKDQVELFVLLSEFKGKFALSINQHENILELYEDYNIYEIQTRYCSNSHSEKNKSGITELLITNYKIKNNTIDSFIVK